jgi:hypothetical protein
MDTVKPMGSEAVCNATPSSYSNATLVRVINTSTGLRLLTVKDVHSIVTITVNTDANATTLFVLTGGDTGKIKNGDQLVNSSNVQVINTDAAAVVSSVVNSSAFVANADILVANGTATVSVASLVSNVTILGNSAMVVAKNSGSTLHSNNNTDVLVMPVASKSRTRD